MPVITDPQKGVAYGRLAAYPNIYTARANPKVPDSKTKFSLKVILDPKTPEGKASIDTVKKCLKAAGLSKWPAKWPHPKLFDSDGTILDNDRVCLVEGSKIRDKDGQQYPEYKGMMVLKLSSPENSPPVLVDSDGRTPLKADSGKLYGGSYGKVGFRVYASETGGPGVFAALNAVCFKKHGDPLGGGGPARAEDYFDEEETRLDADEDDDL